jgi:hypothetical protein
MYCPLRNTDLGNKNTGKAEKQGKGYLLKRIIKTTFSGFFPPPKISILINSHAHFKFCFKKKTLIFNFIFCSTGLELRALFLIGKCSTTQATPSRL